jgi:hypothetical protein
MNTLLAISMMISGGLFAGGVISIAWERIPAWRSMEMPDFQSAFAHTLRRVDRLQPVLLVVCLISTVGFALSASGAARTMALLAASGFLVVLVGSAAWLVPVQKRLVAPEAPPDPERLRRTWLRGHVIRAVVSLAALVLAVVALVV